MADVALADDFDDDSLEEILAKARVTYLEWFGVELAPAKAAAQKLGTSDHETAWETVFSFFHDLKGGGGSVGLDMLSAIGASACSYLHQIDAAEDRAAKITLAHVAVSEKVVAAGILGDGGEAGAALIGKLESLWQL